MLPFTILRGYNQKHRYKKTNKHVNLLKDLNVENVPPLYLNAAHKIIIIIKKE